MTTLDRPPSPSEAESEPERVTDSEHAPTEPRVPAVGYAWSPSGLIELNTVEELRSARSLPDVRMWIDLTDAQRDMLTGVASCLSLHPLIVEDILERNQRSKIEVTGRNLHLVMFALLYEGELLTSEVDIVLGDRFLFTVHAPEWSPHGAPALRAGVAHFLEEGPDYLLWAIADALVDGYFPVFDKIDDEIEMLQDDVVQRPSSWLVERLFQVRRDLLTIRHAVVPQREIFNQLTSRDLPLVAPARIAYFRDVYDHLIRLTDELDSFRELATTTLDVYLSQVNNNLSDVMKRLTAVTAVLAGVGALAGIFGMSEAALAFDFGEGPGFWIVTALIAVAAAAGLVYFRRIGWL